MAFRASNVLPSTAYDIVRRAAVQLKINLQGINVRLSSTDADYDFLREIFRTLERADNQFNTLKTTTGLADYARDQEVDPTYNVVAEFTSMQSTITASMDWIIANVPTNVTAKTPDNWGDGTLISDTFTPAQTSGLRTQLSSVITEII